MSSKRKNTLRRIVARLLLLCIILGLVQTTSLHTMVLAGTSNAPITLNYSKKGNKIRGNTKT